MPKVRLEDMVISYTIVPGATTSGPKIVDCYDNCGLLVRRHCFPGATSDT